MTRERHRAVRIGITGPIGCGKSQVGRWLADRGAVVIDADRLARAVTAPGEPAHEAILRHFGPDVTAPDGPSQDVPRVSAPPRWRICTTVSGDCTW